MLRSLTQLRDDALAIFRAGVAGVDSGKLMREAVRVESFEGTSGDDPRDQVLIANEEEFDLASIKRIAVVGAGKAGAGMAAAIEEILGPKILEEKLVHGWVNVPADCVRDLQKIHLHAARPAGVNEPTEEGVYGTEQILKIVESLEKDDLCIVLLSGGGSALMPAPIEGISLADKLQVTRFLSSAGANIAELNTVRRRLSQVKGGGLARRCNAGRMVMLVISDVLGDPLEIIASGPTMVAKNSSTSNDQALNILKKFDPDQNQVPRSMYEQFKKQNSDAPHSPSRDLPLISNFVIGSNAVAVDCAGVEAERRGYSHAMISSRELEGDVGEIGKHLARMAIQMRDNDGPDCLIMGGEGTVKLAPNEKRGRGGRNQQTVLAAMCECLKNENTKNDFGDIVILSGGTDGEDGPTDAAGAWSDEKIMSLARSKQLDPADFLNRNDAYSFFDATDSLIKTGPTHTNVCDIRVVVINRRVSKFG
jgi:hydroxypyruvate reductase